MITPEELMDKYLVLKDKVIHILEVDVAPKEYSIFRYRLKYKVCTGIRKGQVFDEERVAIIKSEPENVDCVFESLALAILRMGEKYLELRVRR